MSAWRLVRGALRCRGSAGYRLVMRGEFLRSMGAVALVAVALSCTGCSSTSSCAREADEETISSGEVHGNTYISAPNDAKRRGPWAYFPPQRTLIFEHQLEGVPYQVAVWLAFQEFGTLAPSAGNLSIWTTTGDTTIAIKNDSCSVYYAWVEASLPVYSDSPGGAGALGSAGAPGFDSNEVEMAGAAGAR